MNFYLNKKSLILFFLVIMIMVFVFSPAKATVVSPFGNTISEHKVGLAADHEIVFITPLIIGPGSDFTLTFAPGFVISGLDHTDIDLEVDGVNFDLSDTASGSAWGAEFSGHVLTITSDSETINVGSVVVVKIGANATHQAFGSSQIINPALPGVYYIRLGGTFGGRGSALVYVMEDNSVTISALVLPNPRIIIKWAVPELRVGSPETNDDTTFYLSFLSGGSVVYSQDYLATTTPDGTRIEPIDLIGLNPGVYDVIIKTDQHISRKLNNVNVVSGLNVFNFTQADNSSDKGTRVLLAGDINGAGTSPGTLGDNVVNAVDLPILLADLDSLDFDGRQIRANFNQDTVVNSVDLSIMLKNLDVEGER